MRRLHNTSSILLRAPLSLAVLTLAISACDCGRTITETTYPDFVVSESALSFEACPAQDESGNPVADVFPDKKTFTIENIGKAAGALTVTFEGNGKDRFKVVESTMTDSIQPGTTHQLEIEFTPIASVDASASLVIDDGSEETEPVRVTLQGTGINLPAQPTLKMSYEDPESGNFVECLTLSNCGPALFTRTFLGQTNNLRLKIENLGCPSLKITGLELTPVNATDVVQFFIEQPSVAPSDSSPMTLNLVDGTAATEVLLRFEPKDDGTGDEQRWAYFNVKTNDPANPESFASVYGQAAQPAIYVTPGFCDFTDPADTCDNNKTPTTGTNARTTFRITNGGTTPVTIDTVAFRATPSGRFAISGTSPVGQTIAAGGFVPLQIDYTDAPIYVSELIDITASDLGQPAGKATARVSGGVLPGLYTNPPNGTPVDFSGVTTSPATLPVEICNEAGAGTLVINRVQVTQQAQFFKVLNAPPAGTTINGGACITVDIEFTRPVSGGQQYGTLAIESNDPDYAPYTLLLQSSVPADLFPVAVIEGPGGQATGFTVALSQLNPKRITVHGENSYDPQSNNQPNQPVTQYQFFLVKTPNGATATLTDPNTGASIDGVKQSSPQADLNVDPVKVGEYQVVLKVFDSAGQASANTPRLQIFVTQ